MPTYLMLTNLTGEGLRTLKNNPGRVLEAPDEKTMAKISVELGSRGTMTSRTLTAMPATDLSDSL
jgi:uncharacterized protein with GYD domain